MCRSFRCDPASYRSIYYREDDDLQIDPYDDLDVQLDLDFDFSLDLMPTSRAKIALAFVDHLAKSIAAPT